MTFDAPPAPNPDALAAVNSPSVIPEATEATPAIAEPVQTESNPTLAVDTIPEMELLNELWSTYREQLSAQLDQQAAGIELANAQAKYDASAEKTATRKTATTELLNSFIERLTAIRDPSTIAMVDHIQKSMGDSDTATQQPAVLNQMDFQEWRKLPTSRLVEIGVAGLGVKKADALQDKFPTLGDLEDARTEARKQQKHFCKLLCPGFGEKTADSIETIMSDILMGAIPATGEPKEKPKPKSAPVKSEPVQDESRAADDEDDESEEERDERESAEDAPWVDPTDDSEIYTDVPDGPAIAADATEEETEQWAEHYREILLAEPSEIKCGWGANEKKHPAEWTEGYEAYEDWPVSGCPYEDAADIEKAKHWVRGWCAADAVAMVL